MILSGCVANQYIVPETGPVASLTYQIKENSKSMEIFVFDDYGCKKPAMISSVSNREYAQELKVTIPANTPFINSYRIHDILSTDFVTTEFTPKANHNYIVYIDTSKDLDIRTLERKQDGLSVASSLVKPKKVCKW